MVKALYFSHDHGSRNDPKLLKVRQRDGLAGLGLYWCLIEIIHEQGGYILNENLDSVAFDLRITIDELGAFFDKYSRGDNPLFVISKEYITSESALERIAQREAKSQINSQNAKDGWAKRKKIKKEIKKAPQSVPKAPACNKKQYAENVSLKPAEYDKLNELYGSHCTAWMIKTLNDYKEAHGKKYKSDYGAINSWVRGKYEEKFPNGESKTLNFGK